MIPRSVQTAHAKSRGKHLYPCSYCYNFNPLHIHETKGANVVTAIKSINDDEIGRCGCGLTAPTGFGDCDKFVLLDTDYRPSCLDWVFRVLERGYLMPIIMAIYERDGISRKDLIARNRDGYNSRSVRIKELMEWGFVTSSYNIDNEVTYHLTDSGQKLAEALYHVYQTFILVWEEGNLFESYPDAKKVFEYVHKNRGCTRFMIYDNLHDIEDIEVITELMVENDYIQPVYDSTYTQISYETTTRGIRAWHTVI